MPEGLMPEGLKGFLQKFGIIIFFEMVVQSNE
jgi:hypothetical protein